MDSPAGLTPPDIFTAPYHAESTGVYDDIGNNVAVCSRRRAEWLAATLNAYAAEGETTEDDVIGYRDKRPHRAGWARGPYQRICQECERVFVGDKRAVTCAPCAYRDAPPADIPLPHYDAQPAPVVKESLTTEPAPEWSREPPTEAEATIRKFRTVRQEDSP